MGPVCVRRALGDGVIRMVNGEHGLVEVRPGRGAGGMLAAEEELADGVHEEDEGGDEADYVGQHCTGTYTGSAQRNG